jgi:hypothetical protein
MTLRGGCSPSIDVMMEVWFIRVDMNPGAEGKCWNDAVIGRPRLRDGLFLIFKFY